MIGAVWRSEEDWIGEKGIGVIHNVRGSSNKLGSPMSWNRSHMYELITKPVAGLRTRWGEAGIEWREGGGAAVARPLPIDLPRAGLPFISICESLQLQP